MYEILTEKIYREWYSTANCKCDCGRVVNLKGIRRHERQAPHLFYLEKKRLNSAMNY